MKMISSAPEAAAYFESRMPIHGSMKQKDVVSGNIFIRPNPMEKGHSTGAHCHNFDHTTFVCVGRVRVIARKDGQVHWEAEFDAPDYFLVEADVEHEIIALEDGTVFWCLYSHRDVQTGEVIQQYNGYDAAYR